MITNQNVVQEEMKGRLKYSQRRRNAIILYFHTFTVTA
jgi:hypothetical protein